MAKETTKEALKRVLGEADEPLGPGDAADKAEKNYNTVRAVLRQMFNQGEAEALNDSTYCLPGQFPDAVSQVGIQGQRPPASGDGARGNTEKPAPPNGETSEEETLTYKFLDGGPEAGGGGVQYDGGNSVTAPRPLAAQWGQGRVISPTRAYWTRVQGESMEPWLPDQTPIFVEELREFKDGGRYVVWLGDTQADVVKRVERLNKDAIRMISDNGSFPDRTLYHLEGDTYEDRTAELKLRLRIRGRVLYPRDTGQSIMQTVTAQAGKIARQQSAGLAEGIGRT